MQSISIFLKEASLSKNLVTIAPVLISFRFPLYCNKNVSTITETMDYSYFLTGLPGLGERLLLRA